MEGQFELLASDGTHIDVQRVWHQRLCWRCILTSADQYVGDMLWEEKSPTSAHLIDIRIEPLFRRKGVGSTLIRFFLSDLQKRGFKVLTGKVVADRPIEKDRLRRWYERFGAVIGQSDDPENPRYAGPLTIQL